MPTIPGPGIVQDKKNYSKQMQETVIMQRSISKQGEDGQAAGMREDISGETEQNPRAGCTKHSQVMVLGGVQLQA